MIGWMPAQPRIYKYVVQSFIVVNRGGRFCNPVDFYYTNGWRRREWLPIQTEQPTLRLVA